MQPASCIIPPMPSFVNSENTVKIAQLLRRFGISLTVISPCVACELAHNNVWLLAIKSLEAQVVENKITAL
jgi:hypothetical protein